MRAIRILAVAALVSFAVPAWAGETGPHKGPVAVWGDEEYHLEVVADAKAGTVTVFVFGGHDDLHDGKAKPIAAKTLTLSLATTPATVVKLDAAPAKGDPAGTSSVFVGKHEAFSMDAKLVGSVSGKAGTKPYTGDFGK